MNTVRTSPIQLVRICFLALIALNAGICSATAQGTAFKYQGLLNDGGNPATGVYDLQFGLFDAASGGSQQGQLLTDTATGVSNGLFSVVLDFGNQFPGAARWLEIGVRTNGGGGFTTLTPRQLLSATPYAVKSSAADTAGTAATANLANTVAAGAVGSVQLAAGAAAANLAASGQAGVASGGLLLSASAENAALAAAGYIRIGATVTVNEGWLISGAPSARDRHTAVWTGSQMIVWGGYGGGAYPSHVSDGGLYNPAANSWSAVTTTGAPSARDRHTVVWTGSQMIVWGGTDDSGWLNNGGLYNPAANSWSAITTTGAPSARGWHTAVWTGSQMIVWGGYSPGVLNDGGLYNPAADSWSAVTTYGAPAARERHTAVWTGSQMIVWGGDNDNSRVYFNDGGLYNPVANSWSAVTTNGAPAARIRHTAVWTGSQMIVWGGYNDNSGVYLNGGGLYNPAANTWSAVTTNGAPAVRDRHTAVWTGSQMIVWGGYNYDGSDHYFNDGGMYNPVANNWSAVATTGAPGMRSDHTAVWTGSQMIVWGGGYYDGRNHDFNDGGLYNPATDSWSEVVTTDAPAARSGCTTLWTGSQMIVWGGHNDNSGVYFNGGGLYNPVANNWSAVATTGAPGMRSDHTAVWTGSQMIVWGGGYYDGSNHYFNDGGLYNPADNSWSAVTTNGAPEGRVRTAAVWTGSQMIVWGGYYWDGSPHYFNDGGLYNPVANSWSAVTTNGAPSARTGHTAVWTGSQMIVWGGGFNDDNDGGRYNPAANTWSAVTTSGAPSERAGHTAVWTGSQMIVWGGDDGHRVWNDGGLYNPVANSWSAVTTNGAPDVRNYHTAVWTGSQMIIWGGAYYVRDLPPFYLNDGRFYDPAANSWSAITISGAPAGRVRTAAVWTGSQMIVWGGYNGGYLNDVALYTPSQVMFLYQKP